MQDDDGAWLEAVADTADNLVCGARIVSGKDVPGHDSQAKLLGHSHRCRNAKPVGWSKERDGLVANILEDSLPCAEFFLIMFE